MKQALGRLLGSPAHTQTVLSCLKHSALQSPLGQLVDPGSQVQGFPSDARILTLVNSELCVVGCVGVEMRGSYFFIMCSPVTQR